MRILSFVVLAAALIVPIRAPLALESVGKFGEWNAACERVGQAVRCVVTGSDEDWAGDKIAVVYHPEQRSLTVSVAGKSFTATARIDRGAAQAGDCLASLCDFTRAEFGAGLARGTVLFVTVAGAGKPELTFAKNLLDLGKAAAAAQEWAQKSNR